MVAVTVIIHAHSKIFWRHQQHRGASEVGTQLLLHVLYKTTTTMYCDVQFYVLLSGCNR